MNSDDKEKLYYGDDGKCIIYCHVYDKLAITRYYNNHLKSQISKLPFVKDIISIIQKIRHLHKNIIIK